MQERRQAMVEEALAYDPDDPLADLEKADVLSGPASDDQPALTGPCQWLSRPQRIWPRPAQLAIAAAGPAFVVAGYAPRHGKGNKDTGGPGGPSASAGEELFLLRIDAHGLPKPLRTMPIEPAHPGARVAPPGLAARRGKGGASGAVATLAITDGVGALKLAEVSLASAGAAPRMRAIASGVDTRFAPAIDHVDAGTVVAYAVGSTPMRTHVALVPPDTAAPTITNVTPAHVGATAPTFVAGASPPELYAIDARDGMSPILSASISSEGVPEVADVVVPVGMVASPTRLAAARAPFGTLLAYVGIGSAATSAVGLIDVAPEPGAPTAIVPGTAYGPLSVAAVAGHDALYFAADAPTEPGKRAPKRALQVTRVGPNGLREKSVIAGPGGDAYGVAMARNGAGTFALAFNGPEAAYLARLRCR